MKFMRMVIGDDFGSSSLSTQLRGLARRSSAITTFSLTHLLTPGPEQLVAELQGQTAFPDPRLSTRSTSSPFLVLRQPEPLH